jgi:hypothetical protein
MGCGAKPQGMAGIKGRTFKEKAHQFAFFDKDVMDRHIIYLTFDTGAYGFQ